MCRRLDEINFYITLLIGYTLCFLKAVYLKQKQTENFTGRVCFVFCVNIISIASGVKVANNNYTKTMGITNNVETSIFDKASVHTSDIHCIRQNIFGNSRIARYFHDHLSADDRFIRQMYQLTAGV